MTPTITATLIWATAIAINKQVRHDSHMVRAVIPFIDSQFRTLAKPEGRLLLGFSKSGLGAISLLLRHGDVFGFAASWDAPLMFTDRTASQACSRLSGPRVGPLVDMLMKIATNSELGPPLDPLPGSDVK